VSIWKLTISKDLNLYQISNAEYHYFGNTSLEAAQRVCLDKNFLKKVKQLRERINEVELSQKNEFNNEFINAINFN